MTCDCLKSNLQSDLKNRPAEGRDGGDSVCATRNRALVLGLKAGHGSVGLGWASGAGVV